MKISIVMTYYNRKKLLVNTLDSIQKSKYDNYEIIIVDDGSRNEERLESILEKYEKIKLIRIEPENKWYVNPCIAYNKGFEHVTGEIVIIQNPECYHVDDLISYTSKNLTINDYYSYSCYSLSSAITEIEGYQNLNYNQRAASFDGDEAWYNHSIFRPTGYHFTSAIFKEKLKELNGFDERYAHGIEYDDNEFLHRIKKLCNFKIIDDCKVLHQFHERRERDSEFFRLSNINRELFYNKTLKEHNIKVN